MSSFLNEYKPFFYTSTKSCFIIYALILDDLDYFNLSQYFFLLF